MKTTALGPGKLPGVLLSSLLSGLQSNDSRILVGPGVGRDAAAIRIGDQILVLKSDPITFASSGAGRYLINVNANDLACLGARPAWMLVTGMFPIGSTDADIAETFADLQRAATERGIALVGGHTEITSAVTRPVLVGMLIGVADDESFIAPGGARAGDALVLSRPIAIEGSALLATELRAQLTAKLGAETVERAAALLEKPGISIGADADVARVAITVHALHDPTEGGIAMGAREIAEASGLAIELDRAAIPVLPETRAVANALGLDVLGMLASGSLLVACAPGDRLALMTALENSGAQPAAVGRFIEREKGHALIDGSERLELPEFNLDEVSRALNAAHS